MKKQVDKSHYDFKRYITKKRWNCFYHQVCEVVSTNPDSVLEIGIGAGILGTTLENVVGLNYEAMDIDEALKPDHVGSVLEMPFTDKSYDTVACFQVLEHLPYEDFETALSGLFRIARNAVVISLPNAAKTIRFHLHGICNYKFVEVPFAGKTKLKFNGQHYWEINRVGYKLKTILRKLKVISGELGFALTKQYRIWDWPYHHMFVFKAHAK